MAIQRLNRTWVDGELWDAADDANPIGQKIDEVVDQVNLNTNEIVAARGGEVDLNTRINLAQSSAGVSATNAANSAAAAATSEANAAASAANAAVSEANAATSAANAAISETNAANSAAAAATSASNAATSETNASSSASSAATSASNAAISETNAANSAAAASTFETNAANSASAAATSASNAATSETNAANSAANAAVSEANAATSAANAATSETNAANSAAAAAVSETNAANSASAAAVSETNAANSASAAAVSETNAANSASAAATSEANAATSEANALSYLNDFKGRYYGAYSSDPATDPLGNPIDVGDVYYNTAEGKLKYWTGSTWDYWSQDADTLDGYHASSFLRSDTGEMNLSGITFSGSLGNRIIKSIGGLSDLKAGVILFAKVYSGTFLPKQGFVGKLFVDRGSASAFNISYEYDVVCTTAYNASTLTLTGNHPNCYLVKVNYNGEDYYGVYSHATSLRKIILDGFIYNYNLDGNGNPYIVIPDASGYTVTKVDSTQIYNNQDKIWHAGNDGAGSGLDADTLDGYHASSFLQASSYTASDILTKIKTVDGSGSGLDADTLDGYHAGNASGNIPISNGTVNTNLNADLLDGKHASQTPAANTIPVADVTGKISSKWVDVYSLVPYWKVSIDETSESRTTPTNFTVSRVVKYMSYGAIFWYIHNWGIWSTLWEMKVNSPTAISITGKIGFIDDNVYIYLNNNLVVSTTGTGFKNKSFTLNLVSGDNLIQIVHNSNGYDVILDIEIDFNWQTLEFVPI